MRSTRVFPFSHPPLRLTVLALCVGLTGLLIGCDDSRPVTPVTPTPVAPAPDPTPTPTPPRPAITTLALALGSVLAGGETAATVTLSAAAPPGGVVVTLTSSQPAVTVPATLAIAAGSTAASVVITTVDVSAITRATITATSGDGSATAELVVTPVPREASGFRIEPDRLVGGQTAIGRIFLASLSATQDESAPAALTDVVITLTSSHPAVIVPGTILVPGGTTEATFTINTARVPSESVVLLTATSGGQTRTTGLALLSPEPTLSGLSPVSGSTEGGTQVTLSGTQLSGTTSVMIGSAAAKILTVGSAAVTAETPAHTAGRVDVVVTTPDGSAKLTDAYTYVTSAAAPTPAPQVVTPTLTTVSPSSGVPGGGTAVTLMGTNLTGATAVTFDGIAATSVVVVNATTITAVTPAHAIGAVNVRVTTPEGNATLAGGYQYQSSSTLTAVAATTGSASGGLGITLTGTGLTGATSVTMGGVAVTSLNVVSSTTVTAVTPAHATGVVDVVISTPGGGATLANGFTYQITAVGQPAFGGVIAALNGGLNNLIAATTDNSAGIAWGTLGVSIGVGGQSTTDGATNTASIVATLGGTPSTYAAGVCSLYEVDSQGNTPCEAGNTCYNDWFLPAGNNSTATGQLHALYTNRLTIGGFANSLYWSSTETSTNASYIQDFSNAAEGQVLKSGTRRVRCVRAFTP